MIQLQTEPMDPILREDVFDSPDYLYQLKWDGVRMLALLEEGKVELINKKLSLRTQQYPELQALPSCLKASSAVLDGEVVVLKDGKPDFAKVIARDRCSKASSIAHYQKNCPVHYMVFDLLFLNGQDLRQLSTQKRLEHLDEIFVNQHLAALVESFDQGVALYHAVDKMGLEGIVAKRRDSPYLPGKHHQAWFKIKCRRSQECLIGGYTLRGKLINALLLGVYREGSLYYAGRAGTGINSSQQELLSRELPKLRRSTSPFADYIRGREDLYFVEPFLGVKVEFMEWTENLHLRHPVIQGFMFK